MLLKVSRSGESLGAMLTFERFFTCVDLVVSFKIRNLCERFVAGSMCTLVRFFSGMAS
jgi:hypothetical protein